MATMNRVAVTFKHILVPTDFSDVSQRALEYAKTLARQGDSELLLAHVDPPVNLITPPEAAWIDQSEVQTMHEEQLQQSSAGLISEGYRALAISLTGPLYDQLLSAIEEYNVDLIVLGTHGRKGMDRLLLGSDAEALLRHARCPVLSVGPSVPDLLNKTWSIREVLCAVTFDQRSAEVAAYAHKLAAQFEVELVFFHVKSPGSQQDPDWTSFEKAFHQHVGDEDAEIFVAAYPPCQWDSRKQHRRRRQATWFRFDCNGRTSSIRHKDTSASRNRSEGVDGSSLPRDDAAAVLASPVENISTRGPLNCRSLHYAALRSG